MAGTGVVYGWVGRGSMGKGVYETYLEGWIRSQFGERRKHLLGGGDGMGRRYQQNML